MSKHTVRNQLDILTKELFEVVNYDTFTVSGGYRLIPFLSCESELTASLFAEKLRRGGHKRLLAELFGEVPVFNALFLAQSPQELPRAVLSAAERGWTVVLEKCAALINYWFDLMRSALFLETACKKPSLQSSFDYKAYENNVCALQSKLLDKFKDLCNVLSFMGEAVSVLCTWWDLMQRCCDMVYREARDFDWMSHDLLAEKKDTVRALVNICRPFAESVRKNEKPSETAEREPFFGRQKQEHLLAGLVREEFLNFFNDLEHALSQPKRNSFAIDADDEPLVPFTWADFGCAIDMTQQSHADLLHQQAACDKFWDAVSLLCSKDDEERHDLQLWLGAWVEKGINPHVFDAYPDNEAYIRAAVDNLSAYAGFYTKSTNDAKAVLKKVAKALEESRSSNYVLTRLLLDKPENKQVEALVRKLTDLLGTDSFRKRKYCPLWDDIQALKKSAETSWEIVRRGLPATSQKLLRRYWQYHVLCWHYGWEELKGDVGQQRKSFSYMFSINFLIAFLPPESLADTPEAKRLTRIFDYFWEKALFRRSRKEQAYLALALLSSMDGDADRFKQYFPLTTALLAGVSPEL